MSKTAISALSIWALVFNVRLQVKGIWIGMILGVVLQLLALCCMTIRTDWDGQVKKSLARKSDPETIGRTPWRF
ncbi:hypothetical protein NC653_031042 [Populus alba x Populus x berolinensis]|uniref:Protein DETOXIFICATION n=1 Tax=Populus alba x Populus x berolinensis TaxID=444605 RepID=A0AAD6M0A3_9ROSI|nr:hypothetical protein NC653_031042 [Populus alba x Populus x berolinensis]